MKTLFIVLDTVRRDYLGAYGNSWVKTPALNRLSGTGITFDNHWAGSLPCMPARREFIFSHLITDHQHYFELGGENYHTAFSTWDFHRGQEHDGWISLVDRAAMPEHLGKLSEQNWKNRQAMRNEEDFCAPRACMAAVNWLEANRQADNWFLQVELFDPHEPFHCADKYRAMYGDKWDGPLFDWPDYARVKESKDAVEHIKKCYAGLLTMVDHWIGKIFAKMDELDLWKDTLVIFTTDHGTLLAEHDYWMKNFMPLYNEIVRLPLLVHLPGAQKAGSRISALTQSIDVMPTILDYNGCDLPPYVHGKSMRAALAGNALRRDGIFGYFGKATNITDGRRVYFRNPVREDCGPLFEYTAMPIAGMKKWYPRELYGKMEMGRYFGHTYNMPLYKIPATAVAPEAPPGQPSFVGRHELYDIVSDPRQLKPLHDPEMEKRFAQRMAENLRAYGAPEEQLTRLGL
jgi:arylsulfatase A-like enzyme